jgi:hypothetical protein
VGCPGGRRKLGQHRLSPEKRIGLLPLLLKKTKLSILKILGEIREGF